MNANKTSNTNIEAEGVSSVIGSQTEAKIESLEQLVKVGFIILVVGFITCLISVLFMIWNAQSFNSETYKKIISDISNNDCKISNLTERLNSLDKSKIINSSSTEDNK